MGETTQSRGGFVTELPLADAPAGGCCGGPAPSAGTTTQVSACCGEPVAAVEPEETAAESSDGGCCGSAAPQAATAQPSTAQPSTAQSSSCC